MPQKSNNLHVWRHQSNRKLIIGLLGFFLGVFGILCGMFWGEIFNCIMAKEMMLRPDSRVYDKWKVPPLDLSLDIYFFNWTNAEDFKESAAKPILEQLGPYRFTEKPDKINISWHPENSTVTYRRKSDFYFDPVGSNGSLNDQIVTLNAVALSAAGKAKRWNTARRKMVNVGLTLYGQQISVIKTADELLFTGYSDTMIDMARAMSIFGKDMEVPFDKFGWFYTRNGSADLAGTFNVYTGADDRRKMGQMHSWNFHNHTGFFDSYCGYTNGSAGEFYPPNLTVNGSVSLFTSDLCRSVPLDYAETVEVEGITGYKYVGGPRSVDNGSIYPENLCFCGGECVPSGVMNISSCRFGSPVFMSYPHFYMADPFYLEQVQGLQPERSAHELYIILEPNTGIALEVAARFQVNMLVEPIEGVSLYNGTPRTYMPLIWFEQKVRISPELANDLKMLPMILLAGQIFAGVCFALGLILLCWYPVEGLWHRCCTETLKTKMSESGRYKNTKMGLETNTKKASDMDGQKEKTPDVSPLLDKSKKIPMIIPKSESTANVATNTDPNTLNKSKREDRRD